MRLVSALFLAPTLIFTLAAATLADSYDERLAVARDYSDAAMADLDMEAMIRTMWEPLLPAMGMTATAEQEAQLQALYMEVFADRIRDMMAGQVEVMAELFTLEELTDLRDFYATPTGRAVMQKLPQVMARLQPEIQTMVQETLPSVVPQLMAIMAPPE